MKKRIVNYPEHQLFTTIPKLRLYDYVSGDTINTVAGDNMPFIMWPDGTPCLLANSWMIRMRSESGRGGEGPSRIGSKGGSFGDYAGKISHLIRFCYYNKLNFISLSDDDFCQFIDGLRLNTNLATPSKQKRSERTITSIGRRCLNFLHYVGEVHGVKDFVGIGGTISIEMIDSPGYRNGVAFIRSAVHHRSFRKAGANKRRKPIAEATIEALRTTINDMPTSNFLCSRRQMMINIYSEIGGRRGEIQRITITDVMTAARMKQPKITVTTLKRGGNMTREISISPPLVDEMMDYIRTDRRRIIKRTHPRSDHGFLFINERGGAPMKTDSFTGEFSKIRKAAGIEKQVCGHLFRHAFCTNVVSHLIAETEAISPDSFRMTVMTNKELAEQAMAQTGHSTLEGLLVYVDAAYKQKSKFTKIVRNIEMARTYEGYQRRRKRLRVDFEANKISKSQFLALEDALDAQMEKELFSD